MLAFYPEIEAQGSYFMGDTTTNSIQEVIQRMIAQSPHKQKLVGAGVVNAWRQGMLPSIVQRTRKVFFKERKLFIQIDSAPLKHSLQLTKATLLKHLQGCSGEGIGEELQDIVFL